MVIDKIYVSSCLTRYTPDLAWNGSIHYRFVTVESYRRFIIYFCDFDRIKFSMQSCSFGSLYLCAYILYANLSLSLFLLPTLTMPTRNMFSVFMFLLIFGRHALSKSWFNQHFNAVSLPVSSQIFSFHNWIERHVDDWVTVHHFLLGLFQALQLKKKRKFKSTFQLGWLAFFSLFLIVYYFSVVLEWCSGFLLKDAIRYRAASSKLLCWTHQAMKWKLTSFL